MPATIPSLHRDNVDVSRARAKERDRRASKRRGRGRRTRGKKEVRVIDQIPGRVSETLMSFRVGGLRAMHRVSRAPDVSRTFIAAESEFLLYAPRVTPGPATDRSFRGPLG